MTRRLAALRDRSSDEGGYVAVLVAILLPVLLIMCAFTIDVGNWYVTAQRTQRAADAAAMGGVTYMPTNLTGAKTEALSVAKDNGYVAGSNVTIDPQPVTGFPSRLQVTVSQKVTNSFGQLFGVPTETISRTSIADYQGPVPMGSPCNEFGNGPEPTTGATNQRSSDCGQASQFGQFWANVGGPASVKTKGDAFQDSSGSPDGCTAGTNTDYSTNGYFYQVTVKKAIPSLTFQVFDPAFVGVGDTCTDANLAGNGTSTPAVIAKNQYSYSAVKSSPKYLQDSALYSSGSSSQYCTGDMQFTDGAGTPPTTTYTVRQPTASVTTWDPTSYPAVSTTAFAGFDGDLYTALNQYQQTLSGGTLATSGAVQFNGGSNARPRPRRSPARTASAATTAQSRVSSGSGNPSRRSPTPSPGPTSSRCRPTHRAAPPPRRATTGSRCGRSAPRRATTRASRSPASTTWRSTRVCRARRPRSTWRGCCRPPRARS